MSTEYIILLHDNEKDWLDATAEKRAETFARHDEFTRRCGGGGHKITGPTETRATIPPSEVTR